MSDLAASPVAYSYIRFSDPSQMTGDSVRRQTEAADQWCQRNGITLDTKTTFRDLGKSAFTGEHRKNPDRHALALFLKMVEAGRIPRGRYLLIENLDRLSREDEVPACHLLTGLLMAGIRVVQLSPYEMELTEKSNGWELMRAVMELSRGHGESEMKSKRVGAAWSERRKKARAGNGILTRRLPAWVEEHEGELRLIPDRAETVRRIFTMALSGRGLYAIIKQLTQDGVPAFGPSGRWQVSYVDLILKDRRAIGEFQPRTRKNTEDGPPIPNYFPPVVSEEDWARARAGSIERHRKPGRISADVNVFMGLLRSALDGESYVIGKETGHGKPYRVLLSTGARKALGPGRSFPLKTFEEAVLSLLAEINPREIIDEDGQADEVISLSAERARVETSIAAIEADMDEHGESPALFRRLREKEAEHRRLIERLNEAQRKAANPLSEAWGETQTLLAALKEAPDPREARLRLRSALRRVVDSIWLLIVPCGQDRLCAVQMWFAGGEHHRDYLIYRQRARPHQESQWHAGSLAEMVKPGPQFDLRNRDHAAVLEEILGEIDLQQLQAKPAHGRRRKKK
jgi:DNA invertase Pin-like site-specific DNA recombinase